MRDEKFDFWLANGFNLCLVGHHGVGKTALVKSCFERAGLVKDKTYMYFSASTLDPWVDFVGVPRERTIDKMPPEFGIIRELAVVNEDLAVEWVMSNWKLKEASAKKTVSHALGRKEGKTFLELVRPEAFANDDLEAIFIDEFNRAPKKVRNAVMELLQFKSINGKRFPKLRAVWTAINPNDDEQQKYDVEEIDPAQMDRFVVSIKVSYKPSLDWFVKEFGTQAGKAAVQWWTDLPPDEQKNVSPRRLEYALRMWEARGDVRDVLPGSSGVKKLLSALDTGPISERIEALFNSGDKTAAKLFLTNENNYDSGVKVIVESEAMMEFFLPLLNKEKIAVLLSDNQRARTMICSSFKAHDVFQHAMREILEAKQNKPLMAQIRKALSESVVQKAGFGPDSKAGEKPEPPHFVRGADKIAAWGAKIAELKQLPVDAAQQRTAIYNQMVAHIPEKMTGDEALGTLELLNGLMQRAWQTALTSDTATGMKLVVNMANHAIAQLAINKSMSWSDILDNYMKKMNYLLDKVRTAGLANKIFTPAKG
jgi:hypothetical protein